MFEIGKVYDKKQLHEQFGAQEMKNMITHKNIPPIMIVTGDKTRLYRDRGEWISEDTYVYTNYLVKNKPNFELESKEQIIENGDVYLFKHVDEDTVEFENKMKLVRLKFETGYDEEGSYTERIRYELKK